MAVVRLLILIGLLTFFVVVAAPLQWLALRNGWAISTFLPKAFCRCLCWVLQIRLNIQGDQSPMRPQLLVANHVSWTDILVLGYHRPQRFLAKSEVASWPVFGMLARLQGSIFVDRSRPRSIPQTNRTIARHMAAGSPVVLFAEATTGDGTRVKRFHSPHFAALRDLLDRESSLNSACIQPVAIAYARRNGLPLGRSGRSQIAWYGDMTLLPHIWHLLAGGPVDCHVVFCEPVLYQRGADAKSLARAMEKVIRLQVAQVLSGRMPERAGPVSEIQAPLPILLQAETA